jgi:hypothetical protein
LCLTFCHHHQVFERLKAASAYMKLARSFTKSTKTAEAKLAKAAAKLAKLPGLGSMEAAGTPAAAAAAAASPVAAAVAVLAPVLQQASTAKVRCCYEGFMLPSCMTREEQQLFLLHTARKEQ